MGYARLMVCVGVLLLAAPQSAQAQFGSVLDMIQRLSGPEMTGVGLKLAVKANEQSIREAMALTDVLAGRSVSEQALAVQQEQVWDVFAAQVSYRWNDDEGDIGVDGRPIAEIRSLAATLTWEPRFAKWSLVDIGFLVGPSLVRWSGDEIESFWDWSVPVHGYAETLLGGTGLWKFFLQGTAGFTGFRIDEGAFGPSYRDQGGGWEWPFAASLGLKAYLGRYRSLF